MQKISLLNWSAQQECMKFDADGSAWKSGTNEWVSFTDENNQNIEEKSNE